MKMQESCGVATSNSATNLYKVKVKKECCAEVLQQKSQATPSSPPRTTSGTMAIGATATITIACGSELVNGDESGRPVDLDLKSKGKKESSTKAQEAAGTSRTPSPRRIRSPDAEVPLKTESVDSPRPPEDNNGPGRSSLCINTIFAAHEKLKRYLGTFIQFAMDLGPETGDTVRTLVLELLSESMTAEEFHSGLQEATNFPLRGFVLPYLKETLPSLQRDLGAAARAENQSCAQFLRSNEAAVLEAVGLAPSESVERPFAEHSVTGPPGTNPAHHFPRPTAHLSSYPGHAVKRRTSDVLYYENGATYDEGPPYPKRWSHHPGALHHPLNHQSYVAHSSQHHAADLAYCWGVPNLMQIGNQQSGLSGYGPPPPPISHLPLQHSSVTHSGAGGAIPSQNGTASLDDEWKNIHVMINCILGMVDKLKRAVAIVQKRGSTSPAAVVASTTTVSSLQTNGAGQVSGSNGAEANGDRDGAIKRLSEEINRAAEDRVAEVKRRAEEAILDVKRAAVAEVQRAVAVAMADSRVSERLRGHRNLDVLPGNSGVVQRNHQLRPSPFLRFPEARPRTSSSTTTVPSSASSSTTSVEELDKEAHLPGGVPTGCWNCGRPALETCGGCGVARYCGSFCQHRDWEVGGHHATCGTTSQQIQERARSSTPSPPRRSITDQVTSATKGTVARAVK